ncbi:MAG TPA: ABC transporter ATP-binding protein [Candidatus Hydrogenedentes bacterium]|nr:ABC transporter ATP-binding protein [Candidatus Hydrogenedentota bacterium]HIJ74001.1 ABC transporter ATP-binding protein [Candidatus Hydrogenedentota bacterium]
MTAAISIQNLHKWFGKTRALQGLSFDVPEGSVFGFLGPNGAGKTTTMRILATLLRPDGGSASILGHDVIREPTAVRPVIGYMPDTSGAYRDMLVAEYLDFFAAAYRIPEAERATVVKDCIELTGLADKRDELIEGLSRGMRQRLGLARCLINDPKVLILDEPASGLDPRARIEIQEILRTLGAMGKTILISSHILSELRHMCTEIGIIDHGRLIYAGSIDEALKRARTAHRLEIRVVERAEEARDCVVAHSQVTEAYVQDGHVVVELAENVEDFSFVASILVNAGFNVLTIREEEIMLEDAFIKLTGDDQPPAVPQT